MGYDVMVLLDDEMLVRLREAMGPNSFADRYELHGETGRGGMGVVYRAVERAGGRELAIKILAADVHDHTRFFQEVAILERLAHPAIVGYAHHGVTTNGRAYLAMDWLDGESLATRLQAGPLPIAAVVAIGARIAEALAHAHGHGILHRDLKPSNVMLVAGDPGRATLIDFGVAKDVDATKLTTTGQLVGTPAYMAPEQASGRVLDARADLFALGCVLYEALTGEPPFAGQELLEVLAQVLMHEPPPVDRVRPEVPCRLEAVVTALLEKDPEHRVATAGILVAELATIARALEANDRAVLDHPSPVFRSHARTTVDERPTRPRSRRRWKLALPLAVVATGTGLVVAWRWPSATALSPMVATHEHASPTGPITNPPRARELTPVFVETSPPDALGSAPIAAASCAPRGVAILVTAQGTIASVDRAGAVATLDTITLSHGVGDAIACLPTGRIVGVTRGTAWVVEPAATLVAGTPPPNVIDAVAVATTARWLTSDARPRGGAHGGPGSAIWEWNGEGTPREIRETCDHPLRLAPDGNRVACRREKHIIVDDGTTTVEGPPGTDAVWSRDGKALYVSASGLMRRWVIGTSGVPEIVGGGSTVLEAGPWAVVPETDTLARHWIGPGAPHRDDSIDLKSPAPRWANAVVLQPSTVVLDYGGQGLRIVDLDRPVTAPPADRHFALIFGLAFDGANVVTLDMDGRVIRHSTADHTRHLVGELVVRSPPEPIIVPRPDGRLAIVGGPDSGFLDRSGRFVPIANAKVTGSVSGSTDLVRASADGISVLTSDGTPGTTLVPGPLPANTRSVAVSHARDLALVRTGTAYAAVLHTGNGGVAFTYTSHGAAFNRIALAVDRMIVGDSTGQVMAVSAAGVTPVLQLDPPITAIAASPLARRFAVSSGNTVVIYDVDGQREIARGVLDSTILALAWSDDGTRVAAVAASTALAIWQP